MKNNKDITQDGIKILLGQWRAESIARALEKILTTKNFLDETKLTIGEMDDLKIILQGIKEHIK